MDWNSPDFDCGITAEFDLFEIDIDPDNQTIQDLETIEQFESIWTAPPFPY